MEGSLRGEGVRGVVYCGNDLGQNGGLLNINLDPLKWEVEV